MPKYVLSASKEFRIVLSMSQARYSNCSDGEKRNLCLFAIFNYMISVAFDKT